MNEDNSASEVSAYGVHAVTPLFPAAAPEETTGEIDARGRRRLFRVYHNGGRPICFGSRRAKRERAAAKALAHSLRRVSKTLARHSNCGNHGARGPSGCGTDAATVAEERGA